MRRAAYDWVHTFRSRFQEERAQAFLRLMSPEPGAKVLDLGGNRGAFSRLLCSHVSLDITVADVLDFRRECADLGFRFVQVKEAAPLPFSDGEFDIVFSNSVIEHATLPKQECRSALINDRAWKQRSLEAQLAFSKEIRRVGRAYFVQTPHKHFPVDLHLWLPFTNWFPHSWLRSLTSWTDPFWIKESGDLDWNLLTPSDMRRLFPDGRLHTEFLGFLPKSLIAYRAL